MKIYKKGPLEGTVTKGITEKANYILLNDGAKRNPLPYLKSVTTPINRLL